MLFTWKTYEIEFLPYTQQNNSFQKGFDSKCYRQN